MKAFASEPWFAAAEAADEDKATTDTEATRVVVAEAPLLFADWTHHEAEYAARLAGVRAYVEQLHGGSATRAPWDLRVALAAVHAPTLVIVGAHDWNTSPARAADIVGSIAGSTLVTLPNSGHLGHLEEPAAFAAAIHAFVPRIR
jgi:proline iminopeptidase